MDPFAGPLPSWACQSAPAGRRPRPVARRPTTVASPTWAATADATPVAPPDEPVLGRPSAVPSDRLDTFEVEGPLDLVHFRSSELTAVCPVTDQPDFYTIDIEYVPSSSCIETKSLKLYLRIFDNRGVFAEHLAPRLLDTWPERWACRSRSVWPGRSAAASSPR